MGRGGRHEWGEVKGDQIRREHPLGCASGECERWAAQVGRVRERRGRKGDGGRRESGRRAVRVRSVRDREERRYRLSGVWLESVGGGQRGC